MKHSFDIEIAKAYGIPCAVLLENIYFWIEKNRANNVHYHDGHYWFYNTQKAFRELFPYMSTRQINYALKKLIDEGFLMTGNFNKQAYDRTLWYAITPSGYAILQNCKMDVCSFVKCNSADLSNGSMQNCKMDLTKLGVPIPDINTDIYTQINTKENTKRKVHRHLFGEYKNVLLSDEELVKLKAEFPDDWAERIERLSEYIASTGKSYKSHLATIRTWARRDKAKPEEKKTGGFNDFLSELSTLRTEEQYGNNE